MEFEARESGTFIECKDGEYDALVKSAGTENTSRGEAVKFVFALDRVKDKDGKPGELWGFAAPKLTSRSKLGEWAEAILGRGINYRSGERVSLSDLEGKRVKVIIVNETVDGSLRPRINRLRTLTVPEALEPEEVEHCWCGAEGTAYAPDGETFLCEKHAEKARAAGAS